MDYADNAVRNTAFKCVVNTMGVTQFTVMHLDVGESIGIETHADYDQTVYVVSGQGSACLNGATVALGAGSMVAIKGGVQHNVSNTDWHRPLKLIVAYTPPKFPDGGVYETRADAEATEQ